MKDNPYFLMGMLLVMWGSFSAVSKLSLGQLDSFQVQFFMFGFAIVIMTIIMCFNGKINEFRKLTMKDYIRLILYSIPSFLYYFFYILALKMIPAIEASMLNYLFPVMIVIFAIPINREKLNIQKLISIILGFIGMAVVITNGGLSGIRLTNITGDMLALGGAVCWGIFSNLGKRNNIDQFVSNYAYTFVSFVLSFVCLVSFSRFIIPGADVLPGILWNSASNIVCSYYLWFRVLKITTSALAASLSFITPFITLVFIMLLLGEKIMIAQLAGFLLIILGIAVQSLFNIFKRANLTLKQ
jgi:drug/metabolite transporter (DMT)-like permease